MKIALSEIRSIFKRLEGFRVVSNTPSGLEYYTLQLRNEGNTLGAEVAYLSSGISVEVYQIDPYKTQTLLNTYGKETTKQRYYILEQIDRYIFKTGVGNG